MRERFGSDPDIVNIATALFRCLMNNRTCPYTGLPISKVVASREHIVPDALGGPNGFALAADRAQNSRYGQTVDSRLINSTLMGKAAVEAGVVRGLALLLGVRKGSWKPTVRLFN